MTKPDLRVVASHTGGCRCGRVRIAASAEPVSVGYCHCTDCRRATGGPVSAFLSFRSSDVSIEGDTLRAYENGAVRRSFCANCGSPLAYVDLQIPDRVYIMLGAMNRPAQYAPTVHAYVAEQLPFVHMNDDLPRHAKSSTRRPDGSRK